MSIAIGPILVEVNLKNGNSLRFPLSSQPEQKQEKIKDE